MEMMSGSQCGLSYSSVDVVVSSFFSIVLRRKIQKIILSRLNNKRKGARRVLGKTRKGKKKTKKDLNMGGGQK
jgi:hypothetical protein